MRLVSPANPKGREAVLNIMKNRAWIRLSQMIALAVLHVLRCAGLTKSDLAGLLGVSPAYVTRIVKGQENLTLETICRLQDALGVELIEVARPWMDAQPDAGPAHAKYMQNQQTFNINISGEAA